MNQENVGSDVKRILWEALDGSPLDLDQLSRNFTAEAQFDTLGIDSLDVVAFITRVEDHFKIGIQQDDYAKLVSLSAVVDYISNRQAT